MFKQLRVKGVRSDYLEEKGLNHFLAKASVKHEQKVQLERVDIQGGNAFIYFSIWRKN